MDREKAIKYMHDLLRLMKAKEASDLYIAAGAALACDTLQLTAFRNDQGSAVCDGDSKRVTSWSRGGSQPNAIPAQIPL